MCPAGAEWALFQAVSKCTGTGRVQLLYILLVLTCDAHLHMLCAAEGLVGLLDLLSVGQHGVSAADNKPDACAYAK